MVKRTIKLVGKIVLKLIGGVILSGILCFLMYNIVFLIKQDRSTVKEETERITAEQNDETEESTVTIETESKPETENQVETQTEPAIVILDGGNVGRVEDAPFPITIYDEYQQYPDESYGDIIIID